MSSSTVSSPQHLPPVQELQRSLKQLDRRDWSLWSVAAVVLVLLCVTIVSLTIPTPWRGEDIFFRDRLDIAVRGLLALVLLFTTFVIYQQYLIKQLRHKLQSELIIISELYGRTETVDRLSILDELTGLFNRHFAIEYLSHEIARSQRDGSSLTVLMIELDDLSAINERFGRATVDSVLRGFSLHLKKCIRSADLPVRLGEDEFLVILPGCSSDEVCRPLQRIQRCKVEHEEHTIRVEFSFGSAQSRQGELVGELLGRAEEAMYRQRVC